MSLAHTKARLRLIKVEARAGGIMSWDLRELQRHLQVVRHGIPKGALNSRPPAHEGAPSPLPQVHTACG